MDHSLSNNCVSLLKIEITIKLMIHIWAAYSKII